MALGFTATLAGELAGRSAPRALDEATTVDFSASYTFPRFGALKGTTVSVNALNLFDEKYISTMGTNGFTATGDTETLLAGQKRLVFFSLSTTF